MSTVATIDAKPYTKRQRLEILRSQLESERASFITHWRDLGNFILPRRPRFVLGDQNRGERRNRNIIDSTATKAVRTLKSGMMAGMTSPARPWRKLTIADQELAKDEGVKQWLYDVNEKMEAVFHRSHLYNSLPVLYGDCAVFATGAMLMEEDFDQVVRFTPLAVGSYMVANNKKGEVDVFYREFGMTVRQLVDKFGMLPNGEVDWSKFSIHVKDLYDRGNMESWVDVCHIIEPNPDNNPNKLDAKYKKYSSCYYEKGFGAGQRYETNEISDKYLMESGYDFFPVLVPRWETTGEDSYGSNCPGMEALGDIKQLQLGEKKIMEAIEKMINPPMVGPPELRNMKASILPSDITYVASREAGRGFQPAHEVDPKVQELELKQAQMRDRIKGIFYEDLLLMMAQSDRRQITASEVAERHEEKMWAFGSVLEQFNKDLFKPLIDNTFTIMLQQGMIPEPPEELEGMELEVEYISIMAQAQKLIGVASVDRFFGFVSQIAVGDPSVMDKIDMNETVDTYADMTGVPPKMIRSTEDAEAIRQQRQQAAQQQATLENIEKASKSAKDLSGATLEEDSALKRLVDQSSPGAQVPVAA